MFFAGSLIPWSLPTGLIGWTGLAGLAAASPLAALLALWTTWFVIFLTPALQMSSLGPAIRWLVVVAAAVGVAAASRRGAGDRRLPIRWLAGFILAALASAVLSAAPGLSALKLLSWSLGVAVVLVGSAALTVPETWRRYRNSVLGLGALIVALSLSLITSEVGYLRNGRGFQGILSHPQALGTVMVPAFLLALFRGLELRRWWLIGVAAGFGALIVASEARTAGVAVVIGTAAGLARLVRSRYGRGMARRVLLAGAGLLLVLVALVMLGWRVPVDQALDYVLKGRESFVDLEEVINRVDPIQESWDGFRSSPVLGIGFGLSYGEQEVTSAFLGIPTGAPTEKGFVVTALLEEVGLLGSILFVGFLGSVVRPLWRGPSVVPLAVACGVLGTNLGEATLLSFGGMGMFIWLVVATCLGYVRLRRHEIQSSGETHQGVAPAVPSLDRRTGLRPSGEV